MVTELCCEFSGKIVKSFVQNKCNFYWIVIVFLEVQNKIEGLLNFYRRKAIALFTLT